MSTTLLSIGSQTFPVGTNNFGPFSFSGFSEARIAVTATGWPASGSVGTLAITFGSGKGQIIPLTGNTYPFSIGSTVFAGPLIDCSVPAGESSVSVSLQVLQQFTASAIVTAS